MQTLLWVAGCKDTDIPRLLSEKEYHYDNQLSAISADTAGYWIGGETGVIYHIEWQEQKRYDTGLDRIYDIKRDPDEPNMLWIASRNAGLQRWEITNNLLIHRHTFEIPLKGKCYSPYDIAMADSSIFIATSQGLYSMPITNKHGQPIRIYPSARSGTAREGKPFLVNSLCHNGDKWLFAATQNGIVSVSLPTRRIELRHQGEYMRQVAIYEGTLYALSGEQLIVERLDGTAVQRFSLPQPALSFYKVGVNHYFISSSVMQLSEDLKHFVTLPLRHNIPNNPHKIVIPDDRNGFSVMLTKNAILHIPHHFGILNGDPPTITACTNDDDFIYVNNRQELFRQSIGQNTAFKIYDFHKGDMPIDMCAIGKDIFYYNSNNQLCRLTVGNSYLINELFARPHVLFQPDTHITAIIPQPMQGRILLGIQDYLLSIDIQSGKADTVECMNNKYITSFYKPQNSDEIYFSTLNNGVFFGTGDNMKQIPGTDRVPFIRGLLADENYERNLILLTNHQLQIYGTDSIMADGCSRIFYANDSIIYSMPEFGIHKYVIKERKLIDRGIFFADIRFNAQASFIHDNELYAGSDLGVMHLKPGMENHAEWVKFDDNVLHLRLIGLIVSVIAGIIGIALIGYIRQRRSEHRQVQLGKDDLKRRLAGLNIMQNQLNTAERTEIDSINREIDNISITSPDIRKSNEQIASLSARIMRLNRDAALQMVKYLNIQIERIRQIDIYESNFMIKASEQARNSEDIDKIIQQCSRNETWINNIQEQIEQLEKFRSSTEGTLVLQGLNEGMKEKINHIIEEYHRRPIAEMYTDFISVKEEYENIFTDKGLTIIHNYVISSRNRLRTEQMYCHVTNALTAELNEIEKNLDSCNRIVLLRTLQSIDSRVKQIRILHQLRELIADFTDVHNAVIRKNNERRIQKFDFNLFAEIESFTRDITDQITQLSADFFTLFSSTDKEANENIFHFTAGSQQVRVLVLLLASPKLKRTLLPGMLGIYSNLNPVISRLYHGKIGDNKTAISNYCRHHPSSIVYYILKLPE